MREITTAAIVRRPYVESELRAFHTDPHLAEGRHAHTWRVRLYFDAKPFRDGRAMEVALAAFLAPFQGTDLPPALWAVEDIAEAVLRCVGTGDPTGVDVWRCDGAGCEARWA